MSASPTHFSESSSKQSAQSGPVPCLSQDTGYICTTQVVYYRSDPRFTKSSSSFTITAGSNYEIHESVSELGSIRFEGGGCSRRKAFQDIKFLIEARSMMGTYNEVPNPLT
ncbi:hypothetical protein H2248_011162 [Termitomyces sp. 'cryptogamus']|nr:hypothetical protein H2248_011162 [Termitomyces sp. 'cryptogamus']